MAKTPKIAPEDRMPGLAVALGRTMGGDLSPLAGGPLDPEGGLINLGLSASDSVIVGPDGSVSFIGSRAEPADVAASADRGAKVISDHTKPLIGGKVRNLRGLRPTGAIIAARLAARVVELQKTGVLERFSMAALQRLESEIDAGVNEQKRAPVDWTPSEIWDPARETALDHYQRVYAPMPLKPTTLQMRAHGNTSALLTALAVAASRTKRKGGAWPRGLGDLFPGPGKRGRPLEEAPTSDEAVAYVMRRRETARAAHSPRKPAKS